MKMFAALVYLGLTVLLHGEFLVVGFLLEKLLSQSDYTSVI